MPKFVTAPVADVLPKRRVKQPSQRLMIAQEYDRQLGDALKPGMALVVELDPADKALTIRNRIKRAAGRAGIDGIVIRRRKNSIVAYMPPPAEAE